MKITQVIGCAYTYRISKAVRHKLSESRKEHSSHQGEKAFSFFKKIEKESDIVENNGILTLRKHPNTKKFVDHWYEPELAILLGENHKIIGYSLANDLTATGIEFEGLRSEYDPTYYGKVWKGSCGLLEKFVPLNYTDNLEIGLKIVRGNKVYDKSFNTNQRIRFFEELPQMILNYYIQLVEKGKLPLSKQIQINNGFLPAGTVILTGTGLITPKEWYAQEGDTVIIYSN